MEQTYLEDVLDLKSLRCFWAMARVGSLTRAGIELGVSESAVSQRIKALEAHLKVKLYESPGGKVRLTSAGQRLMEMAIGLFDQVEQFQQELAGQEVTGELQLATQEPTLRTCCRPPSSASPTSTRRCGCGYSAGGWARRLTWSVRAKWT